jgi:hypothetical protein
MRCLWLMFVVEGHSTNFALTAFYEVQHRGARRRSVRRVVSPFCSQPSPTRSYRSFINDPG